MPQYPDAKIAGSLWGTVGVEFETLFRSRRNVQADVSCFGPYDSDSGRPKKNGSPVSMIYRDASVEGLFAALDNVGLYLGSKEIRNLVQLPSFTGGSEIITQPLAYDIADEVVAAILSSLEAGGEVFHPRTSIHFHFGFPKHLSALKRVLLIGLKTEQLLYRLAGLGNPYRGCINKSVYARPLGGRTAISAGEGRYAIIDPIQALDANSEGDFWAVLMYNTAAPANRYHPARYYGVNLYGLNLIGTVEFRMFNFSTNYSWVIAVMHLLQLLVEIAGLSNRKMIEELPNSTIDMSREDIVNFLLSLNKLGATCESAVLLTGDDIEKLIEIFEKTPLPTVDYGAVRTHLRDFRYPARTETFPGRIFVTEEQTIDSGNLTIHNITDCNTSILE